MKNGIFLLFPLFLGLTLTGCGPEENNTGEETPGTQDSPGGTDPGEQSSTTQYTITFKDENDNVLESKKWNEGSTPAYNYTKNDTAEWDYTVQGWAASLGGAVITIPTVTADATYYAVVSQVKKQYTITFESNGGSSVSSITAEYGTEVAKPSNPHKDNHSFVCWSYDQGGSQVVSWPLTLVKNENLYAIWNETIDIKSYFQTLMSIVGHDPYSYIPETMQPENSSNHVTAAAVDYDFTEFNNVSNIKYGGFGEQWHMVIENIKESERFYSVLSLGEAAMNASVTLFNNYLDNNPGTTANHTLNETTYTAKIDFHSGVLSYTIQYKTNLNIPFFGEVMPQVDMTYNIATLEKAVRIQLSENNAMRYVVTDDSYVFAIEYGVTSVSRKAYFQINRLQDESIQGHIYEFVQFKDKDLVPSCADFYIDDTYTSVVGNKAIAFIGATGYINELYLTQQGKLLGYEIREEISSVTYNTLWFNLNNISGITNVKHYDSKFYVNNSDTSFVTKAFGGVNAKTLSRRYDIEERYQYFYDYVDSKLTEYEVSIPMMFVQEEKLSEFAADVHDKNSYLNVSINLNSNYLAKIQDDYGKLIDVFIAHKGDVTGATITTYIGDAIVIE